MASRSRQNININCFLVALLSISRVRSVLISENTWYQLSHKLTIKKHRKMSILKFLLIFTVTVQSLSLHRALIIEIEAILAKLEETEKLEESSETVFELLSRTNRTHLMETQLLGNKPRQNVRGRSKNNIMDYIKSEAKRVASLKSPHHRRHEHQARTRKSSG